MKYYTMSDCDYQYVILAKATANFTEVFNNFEDQVIITPDNFQAVKDRDAMNMKYMDHNQFDIYEFESDNDDLVREVSTCFLNGLIAHREFEDIIDEINHMIDAAESEW